MSKQPTWLDRLLARILSGQLPVIAVLLTLTVGATMAAVRLSSDPYLQACAVEVSVGSLFFLVLYLFRIEKFTPEVAGTFVALGATFSVIGWTFSQEQRLPLASAFLLELGSASILFVVIELLLRGVLVAAGQRTVGLATSIQSRREQMLDAAKNAAAEHVAMVLGSVAAGRAERQIDDSAPDPWKAPWEPSIPEPLWTLDDESINWSLAGGIFGSYRLVTDKAPEAPAS